MSRTPLALTLAALAFVALPAQAQEAPADDGRVIVAEVRNEAIRPLLTPPQVLGLVQPLLDAAHREHGQRPQFEQSWIERGRSILLKVDAQFPDGNDFLLAFELEEVEEEGRVLLVMARPRG
ncbi:MAG: hypothetical protein ACK46Q_12905 [Hyphomonas sp.]